MPLALLLQQTFGALSKGVEKLTDWNRLVGLEQLLVDRARGAFLVHWFGSRLPLEGGNVRIAIANLDALRARYQAVRAAASAGPAATGLNLTEPLAGLTGVMAGVMLSPVNSIALSIAAIRLMPRWYSVLLGAVNLLTFGMLGTVLAGAVGILALPLAFAGGVLLGVLNDETIGAVYNLLGALAEMLVALRAFVAQVLGPREQVRNPLVQRVLLIADRLATLLPFVMALFAVLVARIGPLLLPLARQLVAFRGLMDAVFKTIAFIVDDLMRRLTALYTDTSAFMEAEIILGALSATAPRGLDVVYTLMQRFLAMLGDVFRTPSPFTLVKGVIHLLAALGPLLTRGLIGVFALIEDRFRQIGAAIRQLIEEWIPRAREAIRMAIKNHPFMRGLAQGRTEMGVIARAFRTSAGGAVSAGAAASAGAVAGAASGSAGAGGPAAGTGGGSGPSLPFVPPFPRLQVPDMTAASAAAGGQPLFELNRQTVQTLASVVDTGLTVLTGAGLLGPPYALSPRAARAFEQMRQPHSVFAAERQALRDAQGRTPAEQLAAAREAELPLRAALLAVVNRVFPPAIATYVPRLHSVFAMMDDKLYGVKATAAPAASTASPQPPVRTVPESDQLRPVVHRLRIRTSSADRAVVQAWSEALQRALTTQAYTVPAGT